MKNEITISELARLMNVSVHQIRYFEEKGVLFPAYTDDNRYRMYGIDQVYRLAHILLLRKLGLSVEAVKECLTGFGPDQVEQLLQGKLVNIEAEVKRLQALQQFIRKVMHEHRDISEEGFGYEVKWREAVKLKCWLEMSTEPVPLARLLAETDLVIPDLFESDVHYVYESTGHAVLCTEVQEDSDLMLPAGEHLCIQLLIAREDELEQHVGEFLNYAKAQAYPVKGPMILIEKSSLSLFSHDRLHYELRTRIEI